MGTRSDTSGGGGSAVDRYSRIRHSAVVATACEAYTGDDVCAGDTSRQSICTRTGTY